MPAIPPERRDRVFRRDRHTCVYCGLQLPPAELTLDHVQPRMSGGDISEGNLVTACRACNTLKGHLAAWAFLAGRREMRESFLEAARAADVEAAAPVWPRHLRAIREAADTRREPR